MIKISLCMIVKNEAATLARCLDSVKNSVDEIIIVDTGSADETKEIAARYTDKLFDFPWIDDFAAARNFSFSKAECEYCMWLDADDVLEESEQKKLFELKNLLSSDVDVVMLPYNTAFDENGSPTFTFERERIIRKSPLYQWIGAVHEVIVPSGEIFHGDAAISHKKISLSSPDRNLRIYEKLIKNGEALSPRGQFYYARELSCNGRDREAAEVFERFLADGNGWVENNIQACRDLSGCYSRLGLKSEAFSSLLRSFSYAPPKSEICCDIGAHFFDEGNYSAAVFWYKLATELPVSTSGGFVSPDCRGYIPSIQLCVCHYRMGNLRQAEIYNEAAEKFRPGNAASAFNRKLFSEM